MPAIPCRRDPEAHQSLELKNRKRVQESWKSSQLVSTLPSSFIIYYPPSSFLPFKFDQTITIRSHLFSSQASEKFFLSISEKNRYSSRVILSLEREIRSLELMVAYRSEKEKKKEEEKEREREKKPSKRIVPTGVQKIRDGRFPWQDIIFNE